MIDVAKPDWWKYVRPRTIPSVSSVLERGLLKVDGIRTNNSWLEVYTARLVEWAMSGRVKIMISLPDPYSPAPAIVAATAHVGRIIRLSEAAGRPVQSDLRVVVATDDYRIRGLYRRLGIEGVQLHELAPAAVASDHGRLPVLTQSTDGRAWGTAFVARVQDFPRNVRPDLVVVTLPFDGHQQLLKLDAPIIFVSRDPGHPTVRSLARLLPCFGWSREDVRDMRGSVAFKGPNHGHFVGGRAEVSIAGLGHVPARLCLLAFGA